MKFWVKKLVFSPVNQIVTRKRSRNKYWKIFKSAACKNFSVFFIQNQIISVLHNLSGAYLD